MRVRTNSKRPLGRPYLYERWLILNNCSSLEWESLTRFAIHLKKASVYCKTTVLKLSYRYFLTGKLNIQVFQGCFHTFLKSKHLDCGKRGPTLNKLVDCFAWLLLKESHSHVHALYIFWLFTISKQVTVEKTVDQNRQ